MSDYFTEEPQLILQRAIRMEANEKDPERRELTKAQIYDIADQIGLDRKYIDLATTEKRLSLKNPQGGFHPECLTREELKSVSGKGIRGLLVRMGLIPVEVDEDAGLSYGIKRFIERGKDRRYHYYDKVYQPNF